MTKLPPLTEAEIKRQILEYLKIKRILHWRQNVGAAKYKNKRGKERVVKFGEAGMSDILGLEKGNFFVLEVKTEKEFAYYVKHYNQIVSAPKNKKQEHLLEQINFMQNVKDAGGYGWFVCSLTQVKAVIELM